MPIIAIAPNSKMHDYVEAVRRAGGEPRLLDPAKDAPVDIVREVDGLLLPGGGDVLPSIYGAEAHSTFSAAEPGRDEYEITLVRRALDADLPVLAICRGIQLLNVARGGTLVQDIPSDLDTRIDHAVRVSPDALAHDVRITPDSLLARLAGARVAPGAACPVNSRHHQAIERLGDGLSATATAPDGVIEAVEDPARRFCLGVQWHPENFYRTGEFNWLFDGFIAACRP